MNFRHFCNELWLDHIEEIIELTGKKPDYDGAYYFNKYKWWLRREYKFRKGNI